MYSFIQSFIHSFMYSFIHSFIYSFIHLFIHSCIHSFIHSFMYSFIHVFIHLFIHSFMRSICSFNYVSYCPMKSPVPSKRESLNKQRSWKKFQNLINGGGSEFEKRLKMIIKRRKEQKQVVVKNKTEIYTESRYFTLKSGHE